MYRLRVPPTYTAYLYRLPGITVATLGALVLVQLIRQGEAGSPAYIIGFYLSKWLAQGFLAISAFLGALGSFFSAKYNSQQPDVWLTSRKDGNNVLVTVQTTSLHDSAA